MNFLFQNTETTRPPVHEDVRETYPNPEPAISHYVPPPEPAPPQVSRPPPLKVHDCMVKLLLPPMILLSVKFNINCALKVTSRFCTCTTNMGISNYSILINP